MSDVPIKDVSDTAFMVAMYRAMEGERPDALFRDPLSLKLAGERGQRIMTSLWGSNWVDARRARIMIWQMALRTHIIDRFIAMAIEEGVNAVLNLGAGLDTRPYRMMAVPNTLQWIEVDYPHVMELKDSELSTEHPRCNLERIKLDLTDHAARLQLFASIGSRFSNVLVLTEGVIPYLTESDVGTLAGDLRSQAPFKQWIVDYFSRQAVAYRARSAAAQMRNAPFRFDPADYFGFFRQYGWQARQTRYLWDEGVSLERPMPLPLGGTFWLKLLRPVLSQARLEAIRKFMGYVVFEPC